MQASEVSERHRPYAAPANVIAVIQRLRTRNMVDPIDEDFLRLVGVPDGARHRVVAALRFLRLIDAEGHPSDDLQSLTEATDQDYPAILEGLVREAYVEDFRRVDPAKDTQAQIVSAFRPYEPRSQTNRMVILFLGLCREAGIGVLDAPRERQQSATPRPRPPAKPKGKDKAKAAKEEDEGATSTKGFVVTDEDIDVLTDEEFEQVWTALGRVARARARSKRAASEPPADQAGAGSDPGEGGTDE